MRLTRLLALLTLLVAHGIAAARTYDDRTTQEGRAPRAAQEAGTRPEPEAPPAPAPAPPSGPPSDSVDPEGLRRALAAFRKQLGPSIKIVQLTIFANNIVALSTDDPSGSDGAVEYIYRDGAIGPPEVMNTQYLDCKKGMEPSALDLDMLPGLVEDARKRTGMPQGAVLQIVVGQYPCGTAFLNVPVENPGSRAVGVQYDGKGTFVKLNP